jgi:hypothetical protein
VFVQVQKGWGKSTRLIHSPSASMLKVWRTAPTDILVQTMQELQIHDAKSSIGRLRHPALLPLRPVSHKMFCRVVLSANLARTRRSESCMGSCRSIYRMGNRVPDRHRAAVRCQPTLVGHHHDMSEACEWRQFLCPT